MTDANTATLTVTASNSLNGAQFRCIVTDTYGLTATSSAATLTVKPAPVYRTLLIGNDYDGDVSGTTLNDVRAMQGMLNGLSKNYHVTKKE